MSGHDDGHEFALGAARAALTALARATSVERVVSEAALGRVTAEPVFARIAAPHYRGSAMDGIAVDSRSTRGATPAAPIVLAEVPPGTVPEAHAHADPRICVVVDTGSPLPEWADAVVRNESTRRTPGGFEIVQPVAAGRDVRAVGEDIAAGAPLLPRGHRVRPFDVGALLATGVADVAVHRRPTVGVLATGGEIVEPGGTPAPGQIIEYNSRMLAGFVCEAGGEATYLGRSTRRRTRLADRVCEAAARFDLVCVIAGSSHGRKDVTLEALATCGKILFRGIGMVPGRPTGLAVVTDTPVLAIPGYPVSAAIAYRELVGPFLAASLAAPLVAAGAGASGRATRHALAARHRGDAARLLGGRRRRSRRRAAAPRRRIGDDAGSRRRHLAHSRHQRGHRRGSDGRGRAAPTARGDRPHDRRRGRTASTVRRARRRVATRRARSFASPTSAWRSSTR